MAAWTEDYLDVILVPAGLILMFGYHLILVYRYQLLISWLSLLYSYSVLVSVFQVEIKDRGPAISVISANISAATTMSSICLVLSSLLGAWMGTTSPDRNMFTSSYIYGSRSSSMAYVKYISLLACFLAAFSCFVQSARRFVHATYLISMPNNDIPVGCVIKEVIRGSNYWNVGLRFLYLATNLLLWIFGPIPMIVCSVIMVATLVNLDRNTTALHQYK